MATLKEIFGDKATRYNATIEGDNYTSKTVLVVWNDNKKRAIKTAFHFMRFVIVGGEWPKFHVVNLDNNKAYFYTVGEEIVEDESCN